MVVELFDKTFKKEEQIVNDEGREACGSLASTAKVSTSGKDFLNKWASGFTKLTTSISRPLQSCSLVPLLL